MYNTHCTYVYDRKRRSEKNTIPSKTVPDMTISLRQMIERHKSGGKVKTFEPIYTGENSMIPDGFERMDLMEKVELARNLQDFIATSRGRLITARTARERAQQEAAIIERYKKSQESVSDKVDNKVDKVEV